MKLIKIDYKEKEGTPNEWHLVECTFGDINLIVSKNAIGKTRVFRIIRGLGYLLAGVAGVREERKLRYISGDYEVKFIADNKNIEYFLKYEGQKVIKENLIINNKTFMDRGPNGEGKIRAEQLQRNLRFQTSTDEIAVLARRDSLQHPFLEDLYEWGNNLYNYEFGTALGQISMVVKSDSTQIVNIQQSEEIIKDTNRVIEIFIKGRNTYKDIFINAIKFDMESIGYHLDDIGIEPPRNLIFTPTQLGFLVLCVKERDIPENLSQTDISQGMFRALSILIQINYSILASRPSCILIDDIGEGLDFERSSALIKVLIDKAKQSSVQLIMTTNDRFTMNNVPLEYWVILQRTGGIVHSYNYRNSKDIFDEFELTGLNNFDLFSSQYYLKGKNG